MGLFDQRQFAVIIDGDMVSVAPEVGDVSGRAGIGAIDAEAGLGVVGGKALFVEAVLDGGFQVVLANGGGDGATVKGDDLTADGTGLKKLANQGQTQALQGGIGGGPHPGGKPLEAGQGLEGVEPNGFDQRRILGQSEGQIGEGGQATQTTVDKAAKQGVGVGAGAASSWREGQRGKKAKQFLVGDARGQVFAMQQSGLFHESSPLSFVKVCVAGRPTGNGLRPS